MHLTMNQWRNEISVLSSLNPYFNEKLSIRNDRLHLEKSNNQRHFGISLPRDPIYVADHLKNLIDTARQHFQTLESMDKKKNYIFYEEVADFKRQFKHLYTALNYFTDQTSPELKDQQFNANKLMMEIRQYKRHLTKPPLHVRPIKNIEYDERTDFASIKWNYPKRVPLEQTVTAAKKAWSLSQSQPETQPLFIKPMALNSNRRIDNTHAKAYQRYTTQLLHCSFITEEVAKAFKGLADHARFLDLKYAQLASEDVIEFVDFIDQDERPGAIPLLKYLEAMKQTMKEQNVHMITLKGAADLYKIHNGIYSDNNNSKPGLSPADILKTCHSLSLYDESIAAASNPYITPRALQILLNACALSPTCHKIEISKSLLELNIVHDFLNEHFYLLKKNNVHSEEYNKKQI